MSGTTMHGVDLTRFFDIKPAPDWKYRDGTRAPCHEYTCKRCGWEHRIKVDAVGNYSPEAAQTIQHRKDQLRFHLRYCASMQPEGAL